MVVVNHNPYKKLPSNRKDMTKFLTNRLLHWIPLWDRQAVGIPEINVCRGQNFRQLRIDVLEIRKSSAGGIKGYEVKSGISDFRNDKKWEQYLEFISSLYFVFDEKTWLKHKEEIIQKLNGKAGVIVFNGSGDCCEGLSTDYWQKKDIPEDFYQWVLYKFGMRYRDNLTANKSERGE